MKVNRKRVSKIGGQAVMEGVMMRSPTATATAVRTSDGSIKVESFRMDGTKKWWQKVPILRGFISFFATMIDGTKVLMRSADVWGEDMLQDEKESKGELWMKKHLKIDVLSLSMVFGIVLGLAFAIGLFIILPQYIGKLLEKIDAYRNMHYILRNLCTNGYKLIVFILYLSVVGLQKDIKRVFMYHGAEHKVITCYERDLELTVENARQMPRKHDRCGTSFLVIVILVSIIATAFIPTFDDAGKLKMLYRIGSRILLLPFIAGFSYEVLKFLAKFDNAFIRILKAPGLWTQSITTKEPDDSMLEVSIKAFRTVMELDSDPSKQTETFIILKSYKNLRESVLHILSKIPDKETECDWIMCNVLKVNRSALPLIEKVKDTEFEQIQKLAIERSKGSMPLQYVLGETSFYGYTIKTDERALIPRLDTECVVEKAIELINTRGYGTVLDLCTGSGAIGIAIAKNTKATVTCSDISEDALALAKQNALDNQCEISFIQSDLFDNVEGKFDLIISNPPYISDEEMKALPNEVKREPALALRGGKDGMDFYRKISEQYQAYLNEGGALVLEIDKQQTAELFENSIIEKDLAENIRILTVDYVRESGAN